MLDAQQARGIVMQADARQRQREARMKEREQVVEEWIRQASNGCQTSCAFRFTDFEPPATEAQMTALADALRQHGYRVNFDRDFLAIAVNW